MKGGKRENSGRKKSGNKTKILSFRVSVENEKEIKKAIQEKLKQFNKNNNGN
jgi:hypothetical protein